MNDTAPECQSFENDGTYLKWLAENPDSFVLTSNRSLSPRHTVIHRATCTRISTLSGNAKPGGFTRSYIKVGARHKVSLQEWAQRARRDATSRECSLCAGQ